ncbi:sulfite reductase subunit alpha [Chitinolyticbacter albus]|uniref:sulfite reductase subunit alpha n=1 Tax=Chitinolyticbacter albus TaxID=2961951 RepID=UPI00210C9E5B|nr:sulfite reductase subunit alpha [Chitinolyticbacter albus]
MTRFLFTWLMVCPLSAQAAGMPAPRLPAMLAVVLVYVALCVVVAWRHRARRGPAQEGFEAADWTVIHASQTGHAEQLALQTHAALTAVGLPCNVLPLAGLAPEHLPALRRVLFVVSTTGEGDAPDGAAAFVTRIMALQPQLAQLEYGVLALGDRSYRAFCAFGHALDAWLQRAQARSLFDLVEVDNGDPAALRHWQQQLAALAGHVEIADWVEPEYQSWPLLQRQLLNPGSAGEPVCLVALQAPADAHWQAGDLVEIGPAHDAATVDAWLAALPGLQLDTAQREQLARRQLPVAEGELASLRTLTSASLLAALPVLPHREYSIASLPGEGRLELVVRQQRGTDGRLGMGSGWLACRAAIGATVAVRLRENRAFHAPAPDVPLILIGNGTGIAGLRAHLKARERAGAGRNWLLFGERQAAHDALFQDELASWQAAGMLPRLDLVYSRDGDQREYVQHRLLREGDAVRQWVADGAAIYVCGSLTGMAAGVAAALHTLLGEARVAELAATRRYRRDVY